MRNTQPTDEQEILILDQCQQITARKQVHPPTGGAVLSIHTHYKQ